MKIKIISQVSFVTNNLVEYIDRFLKKEKEGYSDAIELELSELARFYLREVAQGEDYVTSRMDILDQALNITEQKIQNKLRERQIRFDFKHYFKILRKDLRYPANELIELKNKLVQSKESKRIGERKRINSNFEIPVEIIELGLRDYMEGLLAFPLLEECDVDLGIIKTLYMVKGENFPYEINVNGFIFVFDDDGTIFISTENFPEKTIIEVRTNLEILARQLYLD